MNNYKCDRLLRQTISSLILGCGFPVLFSISALAETIKLETAANIPNSENSVNEWYQPPSLTNLPDNFDSKSVEIARDAGVNSPITPTPEQVVPIVSERKTHISDTSETPPPEIPPLIAENPPLNYPADNSIEQVTSVSQLSDVQPTDWAFQALQSLV